MTGKEQEQPIIYATLYDIACRELEHTVEDRLLEKAKEGVRQTHGWLADQIRQAYVRGVADGFAQGVAAENESRNRV